MKVEKTFRLYGKQFLIDSDGDMYLTVDSLKEINNIMTCLKYITFRKVSVKPYGFDKMYMDKYIKEDKLYQGQISSMKRTKIYSILRNKIQTFYDGNDRACLEYTVC